MASDEWDVVVSFRTTTADVYPPCSVRIMDAAYPQLVRVLGTEIARGFGWKMEICRAKCRVAERKQGTPGTLVTAAVLILRP